MKREEIIAMIAGRELAELSAEMRYSYLLDWWSLGPEDPDWEMLPITLQSELGAREEPAEPLDGRYDPLLVIALSHRYHGVRNDYLLRRALEVGLQVEALEGEPEVLEICPCCLYRTLPERGGYNICPVCFWEDDGVRKPEDYSPANRLTLQQGRENFASIGACSPRDTGAIRPELRNAYVRSDDAR